MHTYVQWNQKPSVSVIKNPRQGMKPTMNNSGFRVKMLTFEESVWKRRELSDTGGVYKNSGATTFPQAYTLGES